MRGRATPWVVVRGGEREGDTMGGGGGAGGVRGRATPWVVVRGVTAVSRLRNPIVITVPRFVIHTCM